MASAFIQYALTRGEGVVKKSMLCTLAKKLKIVDHPLVDAGGDGRQGIYFAWPKPCKVYQENSVT